MTQAMVSVSGASVTLPALFVPTPEAGKRFIEFFTANIRNPHTRRAYTKAVHRCSGFFKPGLPEATYLNASHYTQLPVFG
ncbi:hypothetical protein [uncultured Thiocystis sp.]|jgi:hypothetical protein|uniref:hypothetical protein n=1 Tax=uncultured Thiocystis sp. TaxID=1202134 RepID=UPI0025E179C9|nr:hypothetical protein [uncultured Thiocystis sp.]